MLPVTTTNSFLTPMTMTTTFCHLSWLQWPWFSHWTSAWLWWLFCGNCDTKTMLLDRDLLMVLVGCIPAAKVVDFSQLESLAITLPSRILAWSYLHTPLLLVWRHLPQINYPSCCVQISPALSPNYQCSGLASLDKRVVFALDGDRVEFPIFETLERHPKVLVFQVMS